MKKIKVLSKITSIVLSTAMLFSILPLSTVSAETASMINGNAGGTTGVVYEGAGSDAWDTPDAVGQKSMWGYRVSVRFCPISKNDKGEPLYDENKNPIYDWLNKSFQVGNTVYFREDDLNGYTPKFCGAYGPDDSVWDLMNDEKKWDDTYNSLNNTDNKFFFNILDKTTVSQEDIDEVNMQVLSEFWDKGLVAVQNGQVETKGHREVQKFLNRMVNMNMDTSIDPDVFTGISKFLKNYEGKEWSMGSAFQQAYDNGGKYMNPDNLGLTFYGYKSGEEWVGISLPYDNKERYNRTNNVEYLRSYFLNPAILNQIAWHTRLETSTSISSESIQWGENKYIESFDVLDFVYGRYGKNPDGTFMYPQGEYKIYIEPCMYRAYNWSFGVMTYQDMAAQYRDGITSTAENIESAIEQIAESMYMIEPDNSIIGQTSDDAHNGMEYAAHNSNKSEPTGSMAYSKCGLGLWVLSSPSLNVYVDPPETESLKVIKTYVAVDTVDSDGNIVWKKASDTTIDDIEFVLDDAGNTTQQPVIKEKDTIDEGVAELNDVITTGYDLDIIDGTTEWVNTELPTGLYNKETKEGIDLEKTARDIAGYIIGKVTNTDIWIDAIEQYMVSGVTSVFDSLLTQIIRGQEYVENEGIAGGIVQSNLILNATKIMTDKDNKIVDTIYTVVYKLLSSADPYLDTAEIEMGKIDSDTGEVSKVTQEDIDNSGGAITTPANTLILRYIVNPEPKQINIVEVYDENGNFETKIPSIQDVIINNDKTYTIQDPEGIEIFEDDYESVELIEWVTTPDIPITDLSVNPLPPKYEPDGQEGSTPTVSDYPEDPVLHNIYVRWILRKKPKVVPPGVTPPSGTPGGVIVPQWRLSKYFNAFSSEVGNTISGMSLSLITGGCGHGYGISNSGTYRYTAYHPNGNTEGDSNITYEDWLHAKVVRSNDTPYVSKSTPYAYVKISSDLNAIKSSGDSGLRVANWVPSNSSSLSSLETSYSIWNSNSGGIAVGNEYYKTPSLQLKVTNNVTYKNWYKTWSYWCAYHHHHRNETVDASVSYLWGNLSVPITFYRYNQSASRGPLSVNSEIVKNENGLTAVKYQPGTELNIYPEYGMLFQNDNKDQSIKWMVSDQARRISPVVYQTMQYKAYVEPTSTGTMATDSRARQGAKIL